MIYFPLNRDSSLLYKPMKYSGINTVDPSRNNLQKEGKNSTKKSFFNHLISTNSSSNQSDCLKKMHLRNLIYKDSRNFVGSLDSEFFENEKCDINFDNDIDNIGIRKDEKIFSSLTIKNIDNNKAKTLLNENISSNEIIKENKEDNKEKEINSNNINYSRKKSAELICRLNLSLKQINTSDKFLSNKIKNSSNVNNNINKSNTQKFKRIPKLICLKKIEKK